MKNCLITKLKAATDNGNLPYYDGITINLRYSDSGSLRVLNGQTAKLIKKSDGSVINLDGSAGQILLSSLVNIDYEEYIFISKYDSFPSVGSTGNTVGVEFNIEDFKYIESEKLTRIKFNYGGITGDITKLPASENLNEIGLYGISGVTGDLATLISKFPNIGANDGALNLYGSGLSGNVSALGNLKYDCAIYLNSTIEGNFYDTIVGWRTNRGGTGEVAAAMLCGPNAHLWSVYPGASAFKLAWTPTTSSITVGGVTTTFDNSGNIIS